MDINLIKKLIKIVEQSEITEFSVQEGDLKVRISKNNKQFLHPGVISSSEILPSVVNTSVSVPENKSSENDSAKETSAKTNLHEVRSPIVGTFYRAPAPDADPYIQVGDHVETGEVLCIIEAMKLMNEIESDTSGKIVKILVDNATPVEYNQPLFLVEKD